MFRFHVIDGDWRDREAVRHILRDRSIIGDAVQFRGKVDIEQAENAEDALEAFAHSPSDFILFDWDNAGMAPDEFARKVRLEVKNATRFAVILAMGDEIEPETIVHSRDLGMHGFIKKPVTRASLSAWLGRILFNPRPYLFDVEGYSGPDRRLGGPPDHDGPERRTKDANLIAPPWSREIVGGAGREEKDEAAQSPIPAAPAATTSAATQPSAPMPGKTTSVMSEIRRAEEAEAKAAAAAAKKDEPVVVPLKPASREDAPKPPEREPEPRRPAAKAAAPDVPRKPTVRTAPPVPGAKRKPQPRPKAPAAPPPAPEKPQDIMPVAKAGYPTTAPPSLPAAQPAAPQAPLNPEMPRAVPRPAAASLPSQQDSLLAALDNPPAAAPAPAAPATAAPSNPNALLEALENQAGSAPAQPTAGLPNGQDGLLAALAQGGGQGEGQPEPHALGQEEVLAALKRQREGVGAQDAGTAPPPSGQDALLAALDDQGDAAHPEALRAARGRFRR